MTIDKLPPEAFDNAKGYLNKQQRQSVLNMAQVLAKFEWATEAEITTVDAEGLAITAKGGDQSESARIRFPKPVESERGLRMSLMMLAMDADIPDGIDRVANAWVETANADRYLKALCNHFNKEVYCLKIT